MSSVSKGHTCEALVLMCIDFRFRESVQENLKAKGIKSYDIMAFPGASLGLSSDSNPAQKPLLNAITISKNLHNIQRVVIVDHEDCGAYGGSSNFVSLDEEKAEHREKMILAARAVKAEVDLPIETWLARLDGTLEAL
ncbi:MAG: hypothetical protein UU22_C0002G0031 [Parcubacteria group bacterium GW2011_GWA2_40_8]|uniref:Carbonic anhydrase n=1 Tax=Candidatus Terrybacteria bacterium RIFCSPLOWO2_01_FULL_40_23 TaxID=1802366 RepID=A0A1G2PUB1_9BACT|nr:MAG: hypothetical protein UU22_C0002G0031 [Parcubacteria group bacterium GW2011_GWA2_40_8]OHA51928.1 MAG: hypothetical protein A3A97_01890 [Candidatus Terrybacteria bacterium RIFCSPLOWO2_01_FULL_40_23]